MIGHGKKCFYINPNLKNTSYKNFAVLDKFTIHNYQSFEKKILDEINDPNKNFKDYQKDDYCVESSNVFEELSKQIKNTL